MTLYEALLVPLTPTHLAEEVAGVEDVVLPYRVHLLQECGCGERQSTTLRQVQVQGFLWVRIIVVA